ncbi:hypothetical protein FPV042 [Fowlpox virus]|uniref:Uncharacterized protein FPV042 n=2 Tax=Fowlpox virus TaxID=10261 RepID=V042_FOWPN|nr:hypothetical protein FPV042 [Fowlpox virus]Q9J5G1.1 RecName: Full=Uncharacterized protein FPV042 [Fowlpox virus strain NVSL]UNS14232.1 ALPV-068 [Albatrosspox virus]WPD91004.1 hypothetical protein PPV-Vac110-fpv042 [Avipoxvirus sp.]CAE52588.1 hypothetical protein [Fowlpox virus isolate HP-438/Munich]AAF44386.1 ORF FPV042 hypothetical protein [Fowlpox virus]ART91476.1 hypothetical protein [Fowlpox virus]
MKLFFYLLIVYKKYYSSGGDIETAYNCLISFRLLAVSYVLSSLILEHLGNRIDILEAVWVEDLVNSDPIISHTGANEISEIITSG